VESPRLPMNCLQNGFVRENIGCAVCDLTVHSIVFKQADHSGCIHGNVFEKWFMFIPVYKYTQLYSATLWDKITCVICL
jgi:hypothetical protein